MSLRNRFTKVRRRDLGTGQVLEKGFGSTKFREVSQSKIKGKQGKLHQQRKPKRIRRQRATPIRTPVAQPDMVPVAQPDMVPVAHLDMVPVAQPDMVPVAHLVSESAVYANVLETPPLTIYGNEPGDSSNIVDYSIEAIPSAELVEEHGVGGDASHFKPLRVQPYGAKASVSIGKRPKTTPSRHPYYR